MQPPQITVNALNPLKGWWSINSVDFVAPIDPTQAALSWTLRAGQCCMLNPTTGGFQAGCINYAMPQFLLKNATDGDVSNFNTATGLWFSISPTGAMTAIPAKLAGELWTTAFDTTQSYAHGDPLRAPTTAWCTANTVAPSTFAGVLSNQNIYTLTSWVASQGTALTSIVGIVSRGLVTNRQGVALNNYNVPALCLWPVWSPGSTNET